MLASFGLTLAPYFETAAATVLLANAHLPRRRSLGGKRISAQRRWQSKRIYSTNPREMAPRRVHMRCRSGQGQHVKSGQPAITRGLDRLDALCRGRTSAVADVRIFNFPISGEPEI